MTEAGSDFSISSVHFTPAVPALHADGVLGFVSVTLYGAFHVDGIALRRTRRGRLALSFPTKRDRRGNEHVRIVPVDDATRRRFERTIFRALGIEKEALGC